MNYTQAVGKKRLPRKIMAFCLAITLSLVFLGLSPYKADAAWIGNITNVTSVSWVPHKKQIKIQYNNAREVPKQVGLRADVGFAISSRGPSLGSKSLDRGKGSHVEYMSVKPWTAVASVKISIPRVSSVSYNVLMAPAAHTTKKTVSAAEAVGTAVVMHVPGIILTFAPQSRWIKAVGATVLGWSVFKDVKSSLTGASSKKCPKLAKGQVITTKSWFTQSGNKVRHHTTTKVWTNTSNYKKGNTPACTVSSSYVYA